MQALSHCLPSHEEQVGIGREGRHAVRDKHVVEVVLGDVLGHAHAVVAQVDDVYLGEVVQQEGDEAVRVGVADYQQGGTLVAGYDLVQRAVAAMNMEYLSFFSR